MKAKNLEVYCKKFWQHCVCFQWYFCLYPLSGNILYHYMYQLQSLLSIYYEQKFYLLTFHAVFYIYHKLQEETKCVHSINFGKFQQKNQYIFFIRLLKISFIHEDFTEEISSIWIVHFIDVISVLSCTLI